MHRSDSYLLLGAYLDFSQSHCDKATPQWRSSITKESKKQKGQIFIYMAIREQSSPTRRPQKDASAKDTTSSEGSAPGSNGEYVQPVRYRAVKKNSLPNPTESNSDLNQLKLPAWSDYLQGKGGYEAVRPNGFAYDALQLAQRYDVDKNNKLSGSELRNAVLDDKVYGPLSTRIALMYSFQNELNKLDGDTSGGISPEDFKKIDDLFRVKEELKKANIKFPDDKDSLTVQMSFQNERMSNKTNYLDERPLYAHPENPMQDIRAEAVTQGVIGNCYFLSSLSSVAESNPKIVHDMIQNNGDGTFNVTFPGDPQCSIYVKAPSETEMKLFNGGGAHGIWASVIEKAHGDYRRLKDPSIDNGLAAEGADGGGHPHESLQLLTGRPGHRHRLSDLGMEGVRELLTESFKIGKTPLVGSTLPEKDNSKTTPAGLPRQHAISILGFEPSATDPQDGTVIIRDPTTVDRGFYEFLPSRQSISLKDFMKNFVAISNASTSKD
jgi:hypothetical protein